MDLLQQTEDVSQVGKKEKRYDWNVLDVPGEFHWIPKQQLNIDHAYQRENVSLARVRYIASAFSWLAFGVILVVQREDGTFWVYDGQHRKLAADARSDVQVLPCLVFRLASIEEEAGAFMGSNATRGPVGAVDKFKAMLVAKKELAISLVEILAATGHRVAKGNGGSVVDCIAKLLSVMSANRVLFRDMWPVIVYIADGSHISEDLVGGIIALERHLAATEQGSLRDQHNIETLMRVGHAAIMKSIRDTKVAEGGGDLSRCKGIVKCLNKGRSTRRISI